MIHVFRATASFPSFFPTNHVQGPSIVASSYPVLLDGRVEAVQQAALIPLDAADGAQLSSSNATSSVAAAAGSSSAAAAAAPVFDSSSSAGIAGAQPVAMLAGAAEVSATSGQQTGSRRLKGIAAAVPAGATQRRQLLQTCPPANPCLVSV